MVKKELYGTTWYGHEASDYAKEQGYLDVATFSRAFDAVLNNDIYQIGWDIGFGWEQENGYIDNTDEIEELEEKMEELSDMISEHRDGLEELEEKIELETNFDRKNAMGEERTNISNCIEEFEDEYEELQTQINDLQNEMDYQCDIYQWFIVDNNGAELIKDYTDYPLYWHDKLGMWLWGVTHLGMSWSYVLTDIKLNCKGGE